MLMTISNNECYRMVFSAVKTQKRKGPGILGQPKKKLRLMLTHMTITLKGTLRRSLLVQSVCLIYAYKKIEVLRGKII